MIIKHIANYPVVVNTIGNKHLSGCLQVNRVNRELNTLKWFRQGFEKYNPKPDVLQNIENELKNYTIELIIDANCKDVQFLIPKLIKTLYLCNIKSYKIHHVDMKKLPIKMDINQNIIEKVPTVIFSAFAREQFRITEKTFYCTRIEKEIEYLLVTMITNVAKKKIV